MKKISMAVIGLGCRGKGLHGTLLSMEDVEVVALCDEYQDRVDAAVNDNEIITGKRPFGTTDYRQVLAMPEVDAVLIATAWEPHIPIAIDAMKAGKACCMEVGGAYSLDDCFALVRTQEETHMPFMFLENCCFGKEELLVTSLVRNGLYGEVVHFSGKYGHDRRSQIVHGKENRHYRFRNYFNRNCDNYPTHELGPIAKLLGINRGNRMVSLVSVASKARGLEEFVNSHIDDVNPNLSGKRFMQGDITTTLITCSNGATIQISLDTSLPRMYDRAFTVHGTKGFSMGMPRDLSPSMYLCFDGEERWRSIDEDEFKKYDYWQYVSKEASRSGHGGTDGMELKVFIDCLKNGKEMPIDVYDAAAWMCISCLSETSIAQGGKAQAIPDFTHGEWLRRPLKDVVELPVVNK